MFLDALDRRRRVLRGGHERARWTLYQQLILDHAKRPHGTGLRRARPAAEVHQVNPTCGDEVTLRVHARRTVPATPVVDAVTWDGQGCSISQASVSVLTTW